MYLHYFQKFLRQFLLVFLSNVNACFLGAATGRRHWGGVGKSVAKMTQQFGVTLCFFPFISAASGSLSRIWQFRPLEVRVTCKCVYIKFMHSLQDEENQARLTPADAYKRCVRLRVGHVRVTSARFLE